MKIDEQLKNFAIKNAGKITAYVDRTNYILFSVDTMNTLPVDEYKFYCKLVPDEFIKEGYLFCSIKNIKIFPVKNEIEELIMTLGL